MINDEPGGSGGDPVPYKQHRSSSLFGSTGIARGSRNSGRTFWVVSIIAALLIVTGITLMLVGAPSSVSIPIVATGTLGACIAILVFGRERAAAASRRRVSRSTAKP